MSVKELESACSMFRGETLCYAYGGALPGFHLILQPILGC